MNKRLLVLMSVIVVLFASCNRDKNSYTLSGKLTNGNKSYIVLMEMQNSGPKTIDTINLSNDGSFDVREHLENPALFIFQGENDYIMLCPQKGEKIKINANFDNLAVTYNISGSAESQKLKELSDQQTKTRIVLKAMSDEMNMSNTSNIDSLKTIMRVRYAKLRENQRQYLINYINHNLGSLTTIVALYRNMENTPLIDFHTDLDIYKKVLSGLEKKYPNNQYTLDLKTFIKQNEELQQQSANGEQAKK
jgi:hypothetical protein